MSTFATLTSRPSRSIGDFNTRGMASIPEASNLINHVVIVGDMSPSMLSHSSAFVKAFDNLVSSLAEQSKQYDQETRVTVYLFSSTSVCAFFDMDVLRLPSIKDIYDPVRGFKTALLDASARALDDLMQTSQKYGQHAFVLYALTDGIENDSHLVTPMAFRDKLGKLPDNWTVAALVPDRRGVDMALKFGFPAGNIDQWDTKSAAGSKTAFDTITRSVSSFMGARDAAQKKGQTFRSTTNLFSMDPSTLNQGNLFKAGVTPVDPASFRLLSVRSVHDGMQIRDFVEEHGQAYHLGIAYYELVKREEIQPQKQIAIVENDTGRVYAGQYARELIGLPGNVAVKVSPQHNEKYSVFIQSTSVNRKVVDGQRILVMP